MEVTQMSIDRQMNKQNVIARQAPSSLELSGKNTGMGSHALLQGIFPTQGSNLGLLHGRQILYFLSQQGNPIHIQWHIIQPLKKEGNCGTYYNMD